MTTFTIGRRAEAAAVEYLETKGFEVLQQNYRTRECEIDIVAHKNGVIYFVEVKYRRTLAQGSGLDYITAKKLAQMSLAADRWLQDNSAPRGYALAAVEVSGSRFTTTNFIESLT